MLSISEIADTFNLIQLIKNKLLVKPFYWCDPFKCYITLPKKGSKCDYFGRSFETWQYKNLKILFLIYNSLMDLFRFESDQHFISFIPCPGCKCQRAAGDGLMDGPSGTTLSRSPMSSSGYMGQERKARPWGQMLMRHKNLPSLPRPLLPARWSAGDIHLSQCMQSSDTQRA